MVLPQTAEYALRAMSHLARMPVGEEVRARDLAPAASIPLPYLSKVLRRLVVAGLLVSRKGHGGGFALARPAEEIRFLDVLESVDFGQEPMACAFGWDACDPDRPCPLHPAWAALKDSYADWAASTTLASVRDQPLSDRRRRRKTAPAPGS